MPTLQNISQLNKLMSWKPGSIPSLDVIRGVLHHLGNPQDKIRCIHVAGTNGKGSCCAYLASIFGSTGYCVGLTTSPHLADVTERIVIDGIQVTSPHLDAALELVFNACGTLAVTLSYFEATIAAAFVVFEAANVDIAIIEVGLGGVWDATNVITKPLACVVTSISLDHQETLGTSVVTIAEQKAGIIKRGARTIIGKMPLEIGNVFRDKAVDTGANALDAFGETFGINGHVYWDKDGNSISLEPQLSGQHQVENAAVALRTALLLGVSLTTAVAGIHSAFWPGRLEKVNVGESEILLDAAHNIDGSRRLAEYLAENDSLPTTIVFGALKTKPWREMIGILKPFAQHWALLEAESVDRVPLAEMSEYLSSLGINFTELTTVEEAVSTLKLLSKHDKAVVCGSIYMLGRIRSGLQLPRRPIWKKSANVEPTEITKSDRQRSRILSVYSELHQMLVASYGTAFSDYLSYVLELPGKMLRSQLCTALTEDLGGDLAKAAVFGAAIELLHTATLVHDDLPPVDNSPVRRGKDSLHIAFTEAKALLAGDVLIGVAIHAAALVDTPSWKGINGGSVLAAAIRDVSIGQILDVDPRTKKLPEVDGLKTGTLFIAACQLALLTVEGLSADVLLPVSEFGLRLGKLFQLRDDLEDGDTAFDASGLDASGSSSGASSRDSDAEFPTESGIDSRRLPHVSNGEALSLYRSYRNDVFGDLLHLENLLLKPLSSFRKIVELTAPEL